MSRKETKSGNIVTQIWLKVRLSRNLLSRSGKRGTASKSGRIK